MSELPYLDRDLPQIARAFYEMLGEGEFCMSRCGECTHESFPPRDFCRRCGSGEWELVAHPGDGTLYAFTTQELALRFAAPDVIGLVELDGGVGRAFGVIQGTLDELAIGQRMVLEPVTVPDGVIVPAWRPA